jgi:hypothetical protein
VQLVPGAGPDLFQEGSVVKARDRPGQGRAWPDDDVGIVSGDEGLQSGVVAGRSKDERVSGCQCREVGNEGLNAVIGGKYNEAALGAQARSEGIHAECEVAVAEDAAASKHGGSVTVAGQIGGKGDPCKFKGYGHGARLNVSIT